MKDRVQDASWTVVPTLAAGDIVLRPLDRADRDGILAAVGDGELWKLFYTAVPGPDTVDGWMDRAMRDRSHGRAMPFAVVDRSGRIIGATRFLRMNPAHRRVEIGNTFYARSVQRSHVNTRAKLLLLGHAFDVLGCACVQLRTDWLNRRSRQAIERLGAKMDGVLRQHTVMEDGRVRDTVCYSIIAGEWPGVRQNLELMLDDRSAPPRRQPPYDFFD